MFVKCVDQGDEAPGLIAVFVVKLRNRDHDDGVIGSGNGEIIRRTQRIGAQAFKRKHGNPARRFGDKQCASLYIQFLTGNLRPVFDAAGK